MPAPRKMLRYAQHDALHGANITLSSSMVLGHLRENSVSSMIQRDFAAGIHVPHFDERSEFAQHENHPGSGNIPGPVRG